MSRHHVLHLANVVPGLPTHLAKSLFLLACHADYRTGESRPGQESLARWGVAYSTWHKHMVALGELGLVKQTVKGCKETQRAAVYRLLYVPALTGESASSSAAAKSPSPERGGPTTGESKEGETGGLTEAELAMWGDLSAAIEAALTHVELQRVADALPTFDQFDQFRRTALRLARRSGEREVVEVLTRRNKLDRPAYDGARNIMRAMWYRLRSLADLYGIDMGDTSPVVLPAYAESASPAQAAAATDALPGVRDALARLTQPGPSSRANPRQRVRPGSDLPKDQRRGAYHPD